MEFQIIHLEATREKEILKMLTSYFETIVDSYTVVRNRMERSSVLFTQFPQMVISCKTIV